LSAQAEGAAFLACTKVESIGMPGSPIDSNASKKRGYRALQAEERV
jgi:hypothetical protein